MAVKTTDSILISFFLRYGTATFLVLLALGITLLIWTFVTSFASPLFLLVVLIIAWKDGMRPGIYATIISGILIDYFFIKPEYQLSGNSDDIMRLFIFAVEGYVLCWLVTWRTQAANQIRDSREQLLALTLRQNTLREEERKKIALEIHDELGQSLTGLKMDLHLLKQNLSGDQDKKIHKAVDTLEEMLERVDGSIRTVRRIATELRPPILDDLGLVAAIEWQTHEFQKRTQITCVFSANIETLDLRNEFAIAVFRIFQETLTNILRHAQAHTVSIILKKIDEKLILRVEDDGVGINVIEPNNNQSLGILGMKERGRTIGGELQVFKGDDGGTVVLLSAPLRSGGFSLL